MFVCMKHFQQKADICKWKELWVMFITTEWNIISYILFIQNILVALALPVSKSFHTFCVSHVLHMIEQAAHFLLHHSHSQSVTRKMFVTHVFVWVSCFDIVQTKKCYADWNFRKHTLQTTCWSSLQFKWNVKRSRNHDTWLTQLNSKFCL